MCSAPGRGLPGTVTAPPGRVVVPIDVVLQVASLLTVDRCARPDQEEGQLDRSLPAGGRPLGRALRASTEGLPLKPAPFDYHAPATVGEAAHLLSTLEDAKPLAGGQSLIPLLALRLARFQHLVDLGRVTSSAASTARTAWWPSGP